MHNILMIADPYMQSLKNELRLIFKISRGVLLAKIAKSILLFKVTESLLKFVYCS